MGITNKSTIQDDERQKCLTYLEHECSSRAFQEKEADFYHIALVKYVNSISTDSHAAKEMRRAASRLAQSASAILKSRSTIASIPDVASALYLAWQKSYSDYLAWTKAQSAAFETDADSMQLHGEHIQQLLSQFERSRHEAEKEQKKLLKRLKLNEDELRELFSECKNCPAKNNCISQDSG